MAVTQVKGPIAVIGGGTMGPGMAVQFARAGFTVRIVDVSDEVLDRTRNGVRAAVGALTADGALAAWESAAVERRISFTTDLKGAVGDVDFVVEAVPERQEIKEQVFAQLEAAAPADAILSSNTSGIPITRLQAGRARPERIVGMHWSNPPHVIPVIEVIQGAHTAPGVVQATYDLVQALRMVPAVVKRDVPGFVENRILYAVMREALHLLEQGVATAADIDTVVRYGVGMKMAVVGPLELLDMAGLDIYRAVSSYLNKDLSNLDGVPAIIEETVAKGRLGIKTGGGLFQYEPEQIPPLQQARGRALLALAKVLESHPIPRPSGGGSE